MFPQPSKQWFKMIYMMMLIGALENYGELISFQPGVSSRSYQVVFRNRLPQFEES